MEIFQGVFLVLAVLFQMGFGAFLIWSAKVGKFKADKSRRPKLIFRLAYHHLITMGWLMLLCSIPYLLFYLYHLLIALLAV